MTVAELEAREAKALRIEEEISNRKVRLETLKVQSRKDRRPYVAGFFTGLGVVILMLALIVAIWHYNVNSDNQGRRQMETCMEIDGTWLNGNTCIPPRSTR